MKSIPSLFRIRPAMTSRLAWFAAETLGEDLRSRNGAAATVDDEVEL